MLADVKIPKLERKKKKAKKHNRGAWVAQLVKWHTLDFSSGHDFRALGSSYVMGSVLSRESA